MQKNEEMIGPDDKLGIAGPVRRAAGADYSVEIFGYRVGKPLMMFGLPLPDTYVWDVAFLKAVDAKKTLALVISAVEGGLSGDDQGRFISFGSALCARPGASHTLEGRAFLELRQTIFEDQALGFGDTPARARKAMKTADALFTRIEETDGRE